MRGEELNEAYLGFAGIYGDRIFAFESWSARKGFPFFTGRDQRQMILYTPRFRQPEKAARPINQSEAESLPPGANPLYASSEDLMVDVETPAGKTMPIDDPALLDKLCEGIEAKHRLRLLRSDRALTDCRPVSIFAVQTAKTLSEEIGRPVNKRSFRANIFVDLKRCDPLVEKDLVGRSIRIGAKAIVAVLERDPRCMMITLDPDTAEKEPAVLKQVAQAHSGMAGLYGAVLREGTLRKGDSIELLG